MGRFDNLSDGRASGPVVGAAFKAVEVRLRAWWVRLLLFRQIRLFLHPFLFYCIYLVTEIVQQVLNL